MDETQQREKKRYRWLTSFLNKNSLCITCQQDINGNVLLDTRLDNDDYLKNQDGSGASSKYKMSNKYLCQILIGDNYI
ncbi:hypothetical protein YC2023_099296 [Brassica napus]